MAHKKKHHKGHSGHHHTGPIHHKDMTSHVGGMGSKDPDAHASHAEMNAEHGTGLGHGHDTGYMQHEGSHDGEEGCAMDDNEC